jgi:Arc/MetJ-type ribon-helix-helix transcriptional regulator
VFDLSITKVYYYCVFKKATMNPLSVRVSENNQTFIKQMTGRGMSKTDVVNHALDLLRKAQLQKELTSMATDDPQEDAKLAEEGMMDSLKLLADGD